jgi:hypothetical protein
MGEIWNSHAAFIARGGRVRILNEALTDLLSELYELTLDKAKVAEIVYRWSSNQFEQFSVVSSIDHEIELRGMADLKAHLVRRQVINAALEIARTCGIGEEESKMPWDRRIGRNIDYAPYWEQRERLPFKELRLSFVCLKRKPTSWYRSESVDEWMEKLTGKPSAIETKERK